jgi:DNA topoisomerase-1
MRFCFNIKNTSNVQINPQEFKKFVSNLYTNKRRFGANAFSAETLPYVAIYSNKYNKVCIVITSKAQKVIEKIENINGLIKSTDLNFGKGITLSSPSLFGVDEKNEWWADGICKLNKDRWATLSHNGPYFTHLMEPYVPLKASLKYDKRSYPLSPKEEEVAGYYAKRLISEKGANITIFQTKDPVFNQNFFNDFREYLTPALKRVFLDFRKIKFDDLVQKIEQATEAEKGNTKLDKNTKKVKTEEIMMDYGYALLDNKREKIGNYTVEPPGIFLGRGEHPMRGKIKEKVYPSDVTINIGEKDTVPSPPPGYRWEAVTHDHSAEWMAKWKDNITKATKYIRFSADGKFKGECDTIKYEKARKLNKHIDDIQKKYIKDVDSKNNIKKQLGTVLYLIDTYGLRVGGDKGEDEADTVGASTLKVDNISLTKQNTITLDFLGKDSIRFYKVMNVPSNIYNNFKMFTMGKSQNEEIFDLISAKSINEYLKSFDSSFTAKLFRTRLASSMMFNLLQNLIIPPNTTDAEIKNKFNKVNAEVAKLLNHSKTISESSKTAVDKLNKEIKLLKDEKKSQKGDTSKIDKKIKTKTMQLEGKNDTLTVAISTSLINYIDPRIIVAWTKKNDIKINIIYSAVLLNKFKWAIDMTGPDWDYNYTPLCYGDVLTPAKDEIIQQTRKTPQRPKAPIQRPKAPIQQRSRVPQQVQRPIPQRPKVQPPQRSRVPSQYEFEGEPPTPINIQDYEKIKLFCKDRDAGWYHLNYIHPHMLTKLYNLSIRSLNNRTNTVHANSIIEYYDTQLDH